MKLSYDPRYNLAYIQFQEKDSAVETLRLSDQLNVDMAPDGSVYGIELLNANQQLGAGDRGLLVVVNEAAGERTEIPLAHATPDL